MKILVTGCAGFIGSHLTEKLLEQNFEVVGIDNFDPFYNKEIKLSNLEKSKSYSQFTFHEVDLIDVELLRNVISSDIDVVVHLAGKAGVRPSIENPQAYVQGNIVATQNLLELMHQKAIKKLVFASSSSIYGNQKEIPFHEEMNVSNPISPYAATKKAAELLTATYHNLHQFDVLNLRFFTVFGPRQRPDLAIHKFVRQILAGEPITMYGDGSSARDYTYIDDTVQGILAAINYLSCHEKVFETINLGNNHPVLLRDLIDTLYEVLQVEKNIQKLPMQPGDVDVTFANIDKAKNLLNYHPVTTLKNGIQQFVEWFKLQ